MKGDEIALLFSSAKTVKNPLFIMKYRENTGSADKKSGNQTHFAVAPSKKIFKTAVLRNKARRRIYNAIRAAGIDTSLSSIVGRSYSIAFIPNYEAIEAPYKALVSAIESSCKHLIKS